MKKTVSIILALIFCICLCSCGNDEIPEGMQLASGERAPFRFFVPSSWIVNTTGGISSAYYSNSNDKSNVILTMYQPDVGDPSTLDEYIEKAISDYGLTLRDFETVGETKSTLLGTLNAKQYEFCGVLGDVRYKYMQVVTMYSGNFYIFTYTAETGYYDAHLDDVARMIEEFRF